MWKKILIISGLVGTALWPSASMAAPVAPPIHAPHLSKDWTMRKYGDDKISQFIMVMNIAAPHVVFSKDSCIRTLPEPLLHRIADTAHTMHAVKVYSNHAAPVTVVDTEFPATPANRETVRQVELLANACSKLMASNPHDIFGYKASVHGSSARTGSSTVNKLALTHYSAEGAVNVQHNGRKEINYDGKVQGVIGESHRKFFIVGQATHRDESFIDLTPWIQAHQ